MKNKIFGFGSAALDFRIITADFGVNYKDKLLAQSVQIFGGGSAANFLVQVSRLGGNAAWFGKLGNDWIGREIIKSMEQEGIDCSYTLIDEEACSPLNIAVYTGDQSKRLGGYLLPNSLASLQDFDIRGFAEKIESGDLVMVEVGEIPLESCIYFLDCIKEMNSRIIVDVDLDPILQCKGTIKEVEAIFSRADILIPNAKAMNALFPDMNMEDLTCAIAKKYRKPVIITAGEEGAYYSTDGGQLFHQPPYGVTVVDTVGAGDAFHGGFAYAISEGYKLNKAVEIGVKCGSMNCTKYGARAGMPLGEEIGLDR